MPTSHPENNIPRLAEPHFGAIDLALLGMAVIWGLNSTVIKLTYAQMTPFVFMALRFLVAATLLLLIAWYSERSLSVRPSDWLLMLLTGLVGTTIYQPLFLVGLSLTTASNTALILAAMPAEIALINRCLGRERLSARGWAGIGLVFSGIALMIQSNGGVQLGAQTFQGDALVLLGTWCWSLYAFLAAPLMQRYSALRVTSVSTAVGAVPLVVLGLPALAAQDWARVSAGGWGGLLYSAIFAVVIAFIIWNMGVQRIGGVRAAVYQNLTPIVATVVAALVLHEALTPVKILGTLLILGGLVLVRTA